MRTSARFTLRRAVILSIVFAFLITTPALCQQQTIQLPPPQVTGGMPLMQALAQRKTTRSFRDQPLSSQMLSNLLWAAFGVNRPREAKPGLGRTAPSAMNSQDIELDVVLPDGVYMYDAEKNVLRPMVAGDVRGTISPEAAAHAAVTIVYVAVANDRFAQVDVGFIGQNAYLFSASEGLNAWFYTAQGKNVAGAIKLPPEKQVLYLQSVGYPPL
ncbi:MAG TPA: nitroreductase family protein [Terracidiphilus sp.]